MFKIFSIGHFKRDIFPVEIEVDISRGIFRFDIIGLGDKAVGESKSRILSAIKNSGFSLNKTTKKVTVLLSPANKKKEGSHFDLPIAVLYLKKSGAINEIGKTEHQQKEYVILGELSLQGKVKSVPKCTEYIFQAQKKGFKHFIVPHDNKPEIEDLFEIFKDSVIFYTRSLEETVAIINGEYQELNIADKKKSKSSDDIENETRQKIQRKVQTEFQIDKVRGQEHVKKALLIALAGKHHLLICGMPGTGKTMIAHSVEDLLPNESADFDLNTELTFEAIANGLLTRTGIKNKSILKPHHTVSYASLIGSKDNPGILKDLFGGILIMDEWAEFDRRAVESLRQPLEEGILHGEQTDFACIATTNPCPCGYFNSRVRKCTCKKIQMDAYRNKIFGPTSQRFDLIVNTNEIEYGNSPLTARDGAPTDLSGKRIGEMILKTRMIQVERIKNLHALKEKIRPFSRKQIRQSLATFISENMRQETLTCHESIVTKYKLNQRLSDSLLLVSQTIADLEAREVEPSHLLEAIGYTFKSQ